MGATQGPLMVVGVHVVQATDATEPPITAGYVIDSVVECNPTTATPTTTSLPGEFK
jgi:hypothetical protein